MMTAFASLRARSKEEVTLLNFQSGIMETTSSQLEPNRQARG